MCEKYLFASHEATNVDNTHIHYRGIGTDETKSTFHCSACSTHLGYYNHEQDSYQVLNGNVDKKDNGKFHCSFCQMPLFDQQELDNADDLYTYFNSPIAENRIALEERNKFYKVTTESHLKCKSCNSLLGSAIQNDSGGFGIRLNLDKVKKRKRKNY